MILAIEIYEHYEDWALAIAGSDASPDAFYRWMAGRLQNRAANKLSDDRAPVDCVFRAARSVRTRADWLTADKVMRAACNLHRVRDVWRLVNEERTRRGLNLYRVRDIW